MTLSLTTYASVDSVTVTVHVEQTFIKNSSSVDINSVFSYELLSLDSENPMPSGSIGNTSSFQIDGTDNFVLAPITFEKNGVYRYQLQENSSPLAVQYTLDTQIYYITVYVRNIDQNGLTADIMIQKNDGSKVDSIRFTHVYTPISSEPQVMVDPPVKKLVSGNPSQSGTFTFLLTAKNPVNPMPEGSMNGVKKMTIVGAGEKEFGTWQYTTEGTYYYTISEVNNGETGYTYDTSVYTITDVVKNVNGQLEVNRTITNTSNKQVQVCTFVNKYGKNGIDGPNTGDDVNKWFYVIIIRIGIIVSAGCITYLIFVSRGKKEIRNNSDI